MRELEDGDAVDIGAFCLHFIRLGAGSKPAETNAEPQQVHSAVG
jgi:hypothetical protein